ncbi:Transducin/WD40 repeat-like superfamily protein [Perilla frutescens var. hirtella]|uniref:Transducin/WD40 repeat-like superfamily protein n=1 Tax=Perilla frutescens var. hirtella TaxID=608512 RepID=A0AAD4P787_PERFH|nr:Transducin/WD40 repeat-like superfamily protein [Perilla frutescens var. hirtella]
MILTKLAAEVHHQISAAFWNRAGERTWEISNLSLAPSSSSSRSQFKLFRGKRNTVTEKTQKITGATNS